MITEPSIQQNILNTEAWQLEDTHQFQWTKQWYPVAVIEFLDPKRPHRIQVLGIDMVLWRDGTGKWQCFADACPHRLAPLSEGRVEADGTLLCAYHAWRFNSDGKCVRIPQSKDAEAEAKNCANPKAGAIAYPTQAQHGLLWVWAESGTEAQVQSQQRLPRLIPELNDISGQIVQGSWNIRDLPYGWDFFMENVADPAHVPVSHHGLVGSRYNDPKYYDMPRVRSLSTQEGFAFDITPPASGVKRSTHDFQPPCLMRIEAESEDGGGLLLVLYATPTRPGWCRHIGCQVLIKNKAGEKPAGLAFFGLPMPSWLTHVLASLFLHQDLVFLHYQEKIVARHQGSWVDKVYTPNPQDKMVITFRQWLEQRAGGGVPWSEHLQDSMAPEKHTALFDVWNTHTKHCYACQSALKQINRLSLVTWCSAALFLILAILLDAKRYALASTSDTAFRFGFNASVLILIGLAGVFGVSGYLLKKLSRLFYVYEFNHADND